MTQRYIATSVFLNVGEELALDKQVCDELRIAQRGLLECLSMEQKINALTDNYRAYEVGLLEVATDSMLFPYTQPESRMLIDVNRRFSNLCGSARSYLDHTAHHLSQVFGEVSREKAFFKKATSHHYDSKDSYKILEHLRNHSQHRGFVIQELSRSSRRLAHIDDKLETEAIPYLIPSRLAAEWNQKGEVIDLLSALGEKVDLRPLVREYVASISEIHGSLRDHLREVVTIWDGLVEALIVRYGELVGHKNFGGLRVGPSDSEGVIHDATVIYAEVVDQRREYERRALSLKHLPWSFVTSRGTPGGRNTTS